MAQMGRIKKHINNFNKIFIICIFANCKFNSVVAHLLIDI